MRRYNEATILRESLQYYRANPVLLIPVLVSIPNNILIMLVAQSMIQQFSKPERFWNLIDSGLLFALFAGLFIGFLVTLGFVAMSARIVTKGKCSLSIWLVGVRRYFWRILNVSIMLGTLGAFTAVVIELLLPVSLYHIPESAFTLALLTCYAAIMIDDASVESSISLGLKTVRSLAEFS